MKKTKIIEILQEQLAADIFKIVNYKAGAEIDCTDIDCGECQFFVAEHHCVISDGDFNRELAAEFPEYGL